MSDKIKVLVESIRNAKVHVDLTEREQADALAAAKAELDKAQAAYDVCYAPVKAAKDAMSIVETAAKAELLTLLQADGEGWKDAEGYARLRQNADKVGVATDDAKKLLDITAHDPAGHYAWLLKFITVTQGTVTVTVK